MTSEVSICNMAIGRLRGGDISAATDPTVEANACAKFYESSRDFVLSDFPWNFAGKSIGLAQQAAVPDEWGFGYAYPSDCLKVRKIYVGKLRQNDDRVPYDVGLAADNTKSIFTNLDLARCFYTVKLTNVNHFDAHFVIALSWYLASEIAIPIAGTVKGRLLSDRAAKGYENFITTAYSANANESYEGEEREPETIRARQ